MRTYTLFGFTFLLLGMILTVHTGCQDAPAPEPDQAEPADTTEMAVNVLTAEEQAEGWMLLFDGTSFEHWRGFQRDSLPAGWTIDDQAMYFTGQGDKSNLITRETYRDFELQLEWKISPAGNSGILYHVSEAPEYDEPWKTGPEMQVLDNQAHPDRLNGEDRHAGANYDMHAPASDVTLPAGAWNKVRLVVNGTHVEHWLNGEKIVEFEKGSDDWKRRLAESKWTEFPSYATTEEGHIALQDHSDPVWFRSIKVRRLTP